MKKIKIFAIVVGMIILFSLAIYNHFKTTSYDGFCTECGSCSHRCGQVFPYSQYKCCECGHIDLGS